MTPSPGLSDRAALAWLLRRGRAAGPWIGLCVGLGLAGGVLLIGQAALVAGIIDAVAVQGRPRNALVIWFGGLAVVCLVRAALALARDAAAFNAGAAVKRAVRQDLLAHLFALGPVWVAGRQAGALASAVTDQVEALHAFFSFYLPQLALAVLVPVAILAFVFPLSWAAGAVLLIAAPLIPLFMVLVGMGAESVSQRHFQTLARMSAHFLDTLRGLATLKAFDRSRDRAATVATVSQQFRSTTMAVLRIAFLSAAVLEFFSSLGIALVAVVLAMGFLGHVDFGTWGHPLTLAGGFFILILGPDFFQPLRELGTHYHARAQAIAAVREIQTLLGAAAPLPVVPMVGQSIGPGPVAVRLQDVTLTFDQGRRSALDGVTLDIDAGAAVALVGPSGAGKSSMFNLIMGFCRPDRGRVLIGAVALEQIDPGAWRDRIAWIGQNPVLFPGTIADNIRLARPTATDEQVGAAADKAGVMAFAAAFPRQLETVVGEQGIGLSKGQVQRVALARALLKDADLLLLDEPTAGLDPATEALVMASVATVAKGRTLVMATHRPGAAPWVDRVVVMEAGRIVADQDRRRENDTGLGLRDET